MSKKISKEVKAMFVNAETLGDLRNAYLTATLKYQTPKLLEIVNSMYIDKFDAVKDARRSLKGKIYKRPTDEPVSFFLNAVQVFKTLDGIECEVRGDWVFITGDTKPVRDSLKSAGCFFNAKQKCWCIGA